MQYFGSNIVEGVAESWVEVDGAGWRWVHGLVIPLFESIKQKSKKSYFSKQVLQYKNNIKKKWM